MSLIARTFILFAFLVVFAGAANVQVIEGDADGTWDHSAKKLRAMAMVYLAELGHVPSVDIKQEGVSFSASGAAKRTIQMKRFLPYGQIEEDSVVIANMDDADEAVESMLTKSFGYASKVYESERPSEVFFMDPEYIDADDNMANLATRNTEKALGVLGYGLVEESRVRLQMFLIKLKDAYWLGMVRMEGSKVVKGAHQKFTSNDDLELVFLSVTSKVMNPDVRPESSDTEVRDYENTHEAKCRATSSASSVDGFFAAFAFDLLCYLSDYIGIDVAMGSKDLYGNWYPNLHLDYVWGFSPHHTWNLGLDYAGTMGQTKSRWAFESIHRFSQGKGLFVDFVWGWGHDRKYEGWYIGGDIGLNLVASENQAHWLSLLVRYDWGLDDDWKDDGRISVNLIYSLRGYFSD